MNSISGRRLAVQGLPVSKRKQERDRESSRGSCIPYLVAFEGYSPKALNTEKQDTYVYMCVYIYIYICIHIYIHTSLHIVCMYVCMYACMYSYISTHVQIYTYCVGMASKPRQGTLAT